MNGVLVLQYLMERQRIPIFKNLCGALNGTYKVIMRKILFIYFKIYKECIVNLLFHLIIIFNYRFFVKQQMYKI